MFVSFLIVFVVIRYILSVAELLIFTAVIMSGSKEESKKVGRFFLPIPKNNKSKKKKLFLHIFLGTEANTSIIPTSSRNS